MRIRFLHAIASADWAYAPGEEADFPDEHAASFISGGIAVAVDPAPTGAEAISESPTRAARPTPRPRRSSSSES